MEILPEADSSDGGYLSRTCDGSHDLERTPFPKSNQPRKFSLALFRFANRCWLEKVCDGQIYMNTWSHHKENEYDPARSDGLEHTNVIIQPRDLRSFRIANSSGDINLDIRPEQFTEPILINRGEREYNVFCLFSLRTSTLGSPQIDPHNFEFGDSFVVILDTQQFLNRLQNAATQAGFAMDCNLVEYYNATTYTGDVGPFRKSSVFGYQREFRVVITPGAIGPVVLELGSLRDITSPIWPLTAINHLLQFTSSPK